MSTTDNNSKLSFKRQHNDQSYTSIVLILSAIITLVSIGFVFYNSNKLNDELYKSAESQGAFIFQALVNQVSDSLYI